MGRVQAKQKRIEIMRNLIEFVKTAVQYANNQNRGISPVIGVILMILIVIVFAVIIAYFIVNTGPQ